MEFIKKILFFNIKKLWGPERSNYYRRPVAPSVPKNEHQIELLYRKLEKHIEWCNSTTEHWAEIKVFEFSKAVITFNLGLLAFNGAAQGLFKNENFLVMSIILSILSLSLLILFTWSVINKNINNVSDRKYLFEDTAKNFPKDPEKTLKDFGEGLNKSFSDLRSHETVWFATQKISLYLFIFAIISAVLGVVDFNSFYINLLF